MPQRERILRAGEREHRAHRPRIPRAVLEIERIERAHERRWRVVHVRRPGARAGASLHQRAERHARRSRSRLEFHFSAGDMQQPLAEGVGLERVRAAEVDGGPGRRLDKEETRDRIDRRVDRAARQGEAMLIRAGDHEMEPGVGPHFNLAELADGDEGA